MNILFDAVVEELHYISHGYSTTQVLALMFGCAGLTALVETIIMNLLVRKNKCRYFSLIVILINVMTNLTLNCMLRYFGDSVLNVLIGEIAVVLWEAYLFVQYLELPVKKAFLYSFIANFVSFWIGVYLLW